MNLLTCGGTDRAPVRRRRFLPVQMLRIMKLTALLLTAAFLHVGARGLSQRVSLSMRDAPMENVFREIERQTGIGFLYTKSMLHELPPITINVKNASIQEVLDICLSSRDLTYTLQEGTVVISKRQLPPSPITPPVPQTGTLHGKVVDSTGMPLAAVSIVVKGTQNGTRTDAAGSFTLKADAGPTLIFSCVGFETREIRVTAAMEAPAPFTVVLKRSASPLDEIRVIGYGTTTRRFSTGNESSINAEVLAQQPVTNPLEALEGRAAGLLITPNSGLPGDGFTVRIRGLNSIAASNNPLYIVDGVPFTSTQVELLNSGSPLNSLSPSDIESISILKDADATAIYGSRAANGVILITTKTGKTGRANLDAQVSSGFSTVSREASVLNTAQYLQVRKDGMANSGLTPTAGNSPDMTVWDASTDFDWQKWFMGAVAHRTDADVSYRGGTDQTTFLLSGSYHNESSVQSAQNLLSREDVHINLDHHSVDRKFSMVFNTFFDASNNNQQKGSVPMAQAVTNIPNYPNLNSNGSYNWYSTNLIAQATAFSKSQTSNLNSNFASSYRLLPGLDLKANFGYNRIQNQQLFAYPSTYNDPSSGVPGRSVFANQYIEALLFEPQLSYNKHIVDGDLQLLAGSTIQHNHTQSRDMDVRGYTSDLLLGNPGYGTAVYPYGTDVEYKYISAFGRINYNWRHKYVLNGTFRRDGSSRFGADRKFGNFGSVGAAWIFSEESFIKIASPLISYGKIRGSWGTTGNDGIGDYQYLSTYVNTNLYGAQQAIIPSRIANNDYSWEVNKKLELAMDLGLFKDRVLLSTSWYRNRSANQLVGYPLPAISGFSSYIANLPAVVQNSGWEFELNTVNVKHAKLQWKTSFNLTLPDNRLIRYDNIANSTYANQLAIGQPLNVILGFHFAGVDPQTGLAQVQDVNKDGRILASSSYNQQGGDYIRIGQSSPDWYAGLSNTLQYQNFELNVFLQYASQKGYNVFSYNYSNFGWLSNGFTDYLGYWKAPGDIARLPKPTYNYEPTAYNFQRSDAGFTDASYLRFKTVVLTYDFPAVMLQRLRMSHLKLFVRAENLITITGFKGYDPALAGSSYLQTPTLKTVQLGIQANF